MVLSGTLLYTFYDLGRTYMGNPYTGRYGSMLSYHFYHIGDKEQALTDMAMAYERMMMRSHSNGGYVNALDECWKMCENLMRIL